MVILLVSLLFGGIIMLRFSIGQQTSASDVAANEGESGKDDTQKTESDEKKGADKSIVRSKRTIPIGGDPKKDNSNRFAVPSPGETLERETQDDGVGTTVSGGNTSTNQNAGDGTAASSRNNVPGTARSTTRTENETDTSLIVERGDYVWEDNSVNNADNLTHTNAENSEGSLANTVFNNSNTSRNSEDTGTGAADRSINNGNAGTGTATGTGTSTDLSKYLQKVMNMSSYTTYRVKEPIDPWLLAVIVYPHPQTIEHENMIKYNNQDKLDINGTFPKGVSIVVPAFTPENKEKLKELINEGPEEDAGLSSHSGGSTDTSDSGAGSAGKVDTTESEGTTETETQVFSATTYEIQKGDKLWNIGVKFYGDGMVWKKILAANPGLDHAHLPIGEKITLPVIAGKGPKIDH